MSQYSDAGAFGSTWARGVWGFPVLAVFGGGRLRQFGRYVWLPCSCLDPPEEGPGTTVFDDTGWYCFPGA